MDNSTYIQSILDGSIDSLKSILPMNLNTHPFSVVNEPYILEEIGVLIGIIGDFRGRIIIDSKSSTFCELGSIMFGMPLEGRMLESFTGEFGNMVAGKICTKIASQSIHIDITPPTVIVGNTKLYGFESGYKLPVEIDGVGSLTILFTIDDN